MQRIDAFVSCLSLSELLAMYYTDYVSGVPTATTRWKCVAFASHKGGTARMLRPLPANYTCIYDDIASIVRTSLAFTTGRELGCKFDATTQVGAFDLGSVTLHKTRPRCSNRCSNR